LQLQDLEAQHYPYSSADNEKKSLSPFEKGVVKPQCLGPRRSSVLAFRPAAATFSDGAKIDNRILIAPKLDCCSACRNLSGASPLLNGE
jgi:hypothetical protein